MSLDVTVHAAQAVILRELLFTTSAGFAHMQKPTGLTSDHFNFHVARLVEIGLVEKLGRGKYTLTHKGKEYANKMDTASNTLERQPKVAVCLIIERADGKTLAQQRLKQPYYGYWGRPTGKIGWGETILQAAARELKEETGLSADLRFYELYHKIDYNQQTSELLEDKLFFVVKGINPKGELIEEFEGGRNQWMTVEELASQELSFLGDSGGLVSAYKHPRVSVVEARHEFAPERY